MPTFVFGCLKQLLGLTDGTLPPVSLREFNSRLQHLINVFEIVCLSSPMESYNDSSWSIGKSYSERIFRDLETGVKSWEFLDRAIDPTCWGFAKDFHVSTDNVSESESISVLKEPKYCTSWNTFHKKGCQYEYLNPGKMCRFIHSCSNCRELGLGEMDHKSWQCFEDYTLDCSTDNDPSLSSTFTDPHYFPYEQ